MLGLYVYVLSRTRRHITVILAIHWAKKEALVIVSSTFRTTFVRYVVLLRNARFVRQNQMLNVTIDEKFRQAQIRTHKASQRK